MSAEVFRSKTKLVFVILNVLEKEDASMARKMIVITYWTYFNLT